MNLSGLLPSDRRGVTLVELIVSILVVGIALIGVLSVMTLTTARSADPMLRHQAVAIAEAYLEEILLRPFADPDGIDGEGSRPLFDDVDDYHLLSDSGAEDQTGAPVPGLERYDVNVTVTGEPLGAIPPAHALRIVVTVTDPRGETLSLVGYRTDH